MSTAKTTKCNTHHYATSHGGKSLGSMRQQAQCIEGFSQIVLTLRCFLIYQD